LTTKELRLYNYYRFLDDAKGDKGEFDSTQSYLQIKGIFYAIYLIPTLFAVKAHFSPLNWPRLMVLRKEGRFVPAGGSLPIMGLGVIES
jgi:hypothetical protein